MINDYFIDEKPVKSILPALFGNTHLYTEKRE